MPPIAAAQGEVTVGSVSLHFRRWGDPAASPVLLLHGGASNSSTWQRLGSALAARGLQAIAPDLRGHGRSSRSTSYGLGDHANDVSGFLDALSLPNVAMVGHSLGAYVAALVTQREPRRVTRLVLEEPPVPNPASDGSPSSGLTRGRILLLAAGSMLRRRRYDPRAVVSAIAQLRLPDPGWWDSLASIAVPTLVLAGGPGSHIDPDLLARMSQALPHARLEIIPVGHRIHSKAPDAFIPLVSSFLVP